ncbi:FAD-dependent oxidoreductase [Dickeya dianthicola]|uniref:FAD-dependent oxidoreductase n=1 Tax=Dickeya dianthicola TaxID=204039 RepID=UPI003B75CF94
MKVMVLGAGVVGVTSAWYLHQQGFEVEVIDRQPGPALEASFANAGGVCPGFAGPWASPGMLLKALRWLFVPQAPLTWRPALSPAQWLWLWRFARNCRLTPTTPIKAGCSVSPITASSACTSCETSWGWITTNRRWGCCNCSATNRNWRWRTMRRRC